MARNVPWKAIAVGGVALGAVGVAVLISRSQPTSVPPRRVALIGDSYAVGLGPELKSLIADFKYEGHVGTNTWQWAHHAVQCSGCGDWLTAFKPDVVLVSLGVNDGSAPNVSNYQTIVQALHGIGARVVWIMPPAAVNTACRSVIDSLGVQTVPAPQLQLVDGLHPSSYAEWAQEIARSIGVLT